MTLFQQRWRSKRFVRGYHGDHIPEKIFKRWFLPQRLPDVRPHKTDAGKKAERSYLTDKYSGRIDLAQSFLRKREDAAAHSAQTPLGTLMFMELERRLDVFLFRCCFAPSVYQSRQMVIHRNVRVNGELQTNANFRLSPGDMVTVDPEAMIILNQPSAAQKTSSAASEDAATESAAAPEGEAVEEASTPSSPTPSTSSKPTPKPTFEFPPYASPFLFLPAYIEANPATCSAVYVRHPTARPGYSEVPSPYDAGGEVMRFAWEWYAKRRSRERKGGILSRWKNPQFTRK
ncbi:alpha-L RNA-binding motif-containing protein [Clavulina sp. PMI_390]|nr:alpha-L RNA-binding motif-containing protein [Clavulina sp. PMI_390]